MADTKISALTAITGANVAPDDIIPIVDTSVTTTKSITREEFQTYNAGTFTTDKKVLDLSVTWNNAAVTFTGWKLNVTSTASAAASLLVDWQLGGVTQYKFNKSAAGTGAGAPAFALIDAGFRRNLAANLTVISGGNDEFTFNGYTLKLAQTGAFSWVNNGQSTGGTIDLTVTRDAANTLAQRNGTNAQSFNLYNTYTDASNYERGFMRWNSNVLEIGAEAAGTGTLRKLRLKGAWATAIEMYSGTVHVAAVGETLSIFTRAIGLGWGAAGSAAAGFRLTADQTIIQLSASLTSATGAAFEVNEMTAPAAPATNSVRIYAQDNGSGKTQLMALFATGAAQQLAIEP